MCPQWLDFSREPDHPLVVQRLAEERALKIIQQISQLERDIQRLQEFNGQARRKSEAISDQREGVFRRALLAGDQRTAVDIYRKPFRDIMVSYLERSRQRARIQALKTELKNDTMSTRTAKRELRLAEVKIKGAAKVFASAYREYLKAMGTLKELSASTEQGVSEAVAKVSKNLSINNLRQNFPELDLPERVEKEVLVEEFRTHPDILIELLKSDRSSEAKHATRLVLLNVSTLKMWDQVLTKSFPLQWSKLKGLVSVGVVINMRDKHLSNVEKILDMPGSSPENIKARLEELRDWNSTTLGDEFLVAFAGTTRASEAWNELKAAALELGKSNTIYANFHERMKLAEKLSFGNPNISIDQKISGAEASAMGFAAVSTTAFGAIASNWHSISNWFQSTVTLENSRILVDSVIEAAKLVAP